MLYFNELFILDGYNIETAIKNDWQTNLTKSVLTESRLFFEKVRKLDIV